MASLDVLWSFSWLFGEGVVLSESEVDLPLSPLLLLALGSQPLSALYLTESVSSDKHALFRLRMVTLI